MRSRAGRLGFVCGVVCLVVSLSTTRAGAAAPLTAVFGGNTTALTPMPTVGGSGAYTFSSATPSPQGVPGFCVGTVAVATNILCTLTLSGTWQQVVCGTGVTGGGPLAQTDTGFVDFGSAGFGFRYSITYVDFVGILIGNAAGAPVFGWVVLTPTGGNCTTGVTNLTATGQLAFG